MAKRKRTLASKKSKKANKIGFPKRSDGSPSSFAYLAILVIVVLVLLALSSLGPSIAATGQVTGFATSSDDEQVLSQQQDELRELLGGIIEEDVQPAGQLTVAQPQTTGLPLEFIIIGVVVVVVLILVLLYMKKKKSGPSYSSPIPSYTPSQ